MYVLFVNILIVIFLLECTHSADNVFHSHTVIWEKEYFLTATLLCCFTNVKSCTLVCLPVLILKKKIIRVYIFMTIQYLKKIIFDPVPIFASPVLLGNIPLIFLRSNISKPRNEFSCSPLYFFNVFPDIWAPFLYTIF